MKRYSYLLLAVLILAGCGAARKGGDVNPDYKLLKDYSWNWEKVEGSDMETASAIVSVFSSSQSISMVRIPMKGHTFSVVDAGGPAADITSSLANAEGAIAAINGSYFNMKTLWPVTFVKDEGVVVCSSTSDAFNRNNGMIRINSSKLDIVLTDTLSYEKDSKKWYEAMVTGPLLMENGRVIEYASNEDPLQGRVTVDSPSYKRVFLKRHPRSLLGYTRSGMLYLVVVDGRFPGQADGMSIEELQILSKALGLYESINLDGGGSSTLWIRDGGVLNHPFDNRRFDHEGERKVPNIIIVK